MYKKKENIMFTEAANKVVLFKFLLKQMAFRDRTFIPVCNARYVTELLNIGTPSI